MTPRAHTVRVEKRHVHDLPVLSISGTVDLSTSPDLRDALFAAAQGIPGPVLVDLARVHYMDSSGVGTMVYFRRALERNGQPVVLIGLQPRVRSVFEITHLDRFFRIVNTVDEAIAVARAPAAG
ncbi:MAG: STAS domain-containing protein [Planctomycetota bacterium]